MKKVAREFYFQVFSRLILMRISIQVQLMNGLKVVLLGLKEFHGLHDDLKII